MIRVTLDAKIKSHVAGDAGLPNVPRFVVLLRPQRGMSNVPKQVFHLFTESFVYRSRKLLK